MHNPHQEVPDEPAAVSPPVRESLSCWLLPQSCALHGGQERCMAAWAGARQQPSACAAACSTAKPQQAVGSASAKHAEQLLLQCWQTQAAMLSADGKQREHKLKRRCRGAAGSVLQPYSSSVTSSRKPTSGSFGIAAAALALRSPWLSHMCVVLQATTAKEPCSCSAGRNSVDWARDLRKTEQHCTEPCLLICLLHAVAQVTDVLHPGRPNVPKAELKERLAKMYDVRDPNCIFVFGFRTEVGLHSNCPQPAAWQ